jgi:MoaA/NifB/PqqE/SkfB family radical SAM enzyme
MASTGHPILAQIVPIRRCNLSCAYCNEFDSVSDPVPAPEMLRRIDRLAELGTTVVTLSGGEPLLHPELDDLVRRIRERGAMATLITNGYLLTVDRIRRLDRAGLDHLQISIDNVVPDSISKKSLKTLDRKLQWLSEAAEFAVTVNSVVGGVAGQSQDAMEVARRARELGFTATAGILHDGGGQAQKLDAGQMAAFDQIRRASGGVFSFAHYDSFQHNIARGLPNEWTCRAGARFLYICENGLVHYCSQQRGRPGIPLAEYGPEHLRREFAWGKPCSPFCTISCVNQMAMLDTIREDPRRALADLIERRRRVDPAFQPPRMLAALEWMFLDRRRAGFFNRLALKLLAASSPAPADGGDRRPPQS